MRAAVDAGLQREREREKIFFDSGPAIAHFVWKSFFLEVSLSLEVSLFELPKPSQNEKRLLPLDSIRIY